MIGHLPAEWQPKTLFCVYLRQGDHVIMGNDAYGGTFRLISKVFTRFGISYSSANLSDPDEVKAAFH